MAGQLARPPLLWDNWPVNDGPRMSRHLHLRAFTGRPAANAGRISGHAVNPALQPTLSLIPALTLADAYGQGEAYGYTHAWRAAAERVCGSELADLLQRHILAFEDGGLDSLDAEIDPEDLEDAEPFEEGDLGLLSDIGLPEAVLGVILDESDLYADEQLGRIAREMGFAEQLSAVIDRLGR